MFHRTIGVWTAAVVLGAACAPTPPPATGDGAEDDASGNTTATIAGVLTVLPREAGAVVLDIEPNDTPQVDGPASVVATGQRLEIFGDVSAETEDVRDVYLLDIDTAGPVEVQAILSFDFNPTDPAENNLAFGIIDDDPPTCTLSDGDLPLSHCVNTTRNPEVATFRAEQRFTIVVQALSGSAAYVMGLELRSAADPAPVIGDAGQRWRPPPRPAPAGVRESELLVRFEPKISAAQRQAMARAHGLSIAGHSPAGVFRLRCSNPQPGERIATYRHIIRSTRQLRRTAGVRWCEPNYLYQPALEPDDQFYSLQWHFDVLNLADAWDITTGSAEVTIAVIDTGVLGDHPDLSGRLMPGYDFISDPDAARDGDGPDPDPTDNGDLQGGPLRSSFHGTHVTGTVGAITDNGLDIAGVTWNCGIMPLRALGVGGGSSFDIAEAIRYAAAIDNVSGRIPERPAKVINLSIATPAGSPPSAALQEAISEAVARGVVVVAAAGNDGSELPAYPGGFDNVLSVAACDPQLRRAPYSNYGSTIDLTAPGGNLAFDLTGDGFGDGVLSLLGTETDQGLLFTLSFQHGTSMASPHVAGVAALMLSVNPQLSVEEIREILSSTAIDVGEPGPDVEYGAGIVNAASAVAEAAVRAEVLTLTEPRLSLSATVLNFATTIDTLTVQVTNTGGGVLDITAATVEEFIGQNWLSVDLRPGNAASTVSAIEVAVDRSAQSDGSYVGRITLVPADLPAQSISVEMRVGDTPVVEDVVFVVAVDAISRRSVAQAATTAASGFAFQLENLPPNAYKLYAGTDRDNDDLICDPGELCGGFRSAIDANEIVVHAGDEVGDLDFAVGDLVFEPQGVGAARPPAIRLVE